MNKHSFQRKWTDLLFVFAFTAIWLFLGRANEEAGAFGVTLRPPFNDAADGSTYRITAYFDHYYPNYNSDPDYPYITVYTGETVEQGNPYEYSGHPGYDFGMNIGVPLYAAAGGVAIIDDIPTGTLGKWVCIQHTSDLATIYGHMNTISIGSGPVSSGQLIGTSGNTGTTAAHLHFSVVKSCIHAPSESYNNPIDPFGWQGTDPDPVISFSDRGSSCLWQSADQDPISCADRVYEDGSLGTYRTGEGWVEEVDGHGYQKFRRYNSSGNEIGAWWYGVPTTQAAKVYAWIPPLATTQQARYGIWTLFGWQYVTIDQSIDQNRWRLLGSFLFTPDDPINDYVILFANTGEPVGTKWVAIDGIKFRTYINNLPITFKDYCFPGTDERLVNGNFETGNIDGWDWLREPPSPALPIVLPYSSGYGARLGGIVDTHDYIMQSTCIPANTALAMLNYSIWISSEEPLNEPIYDTMVVSVKDENGYVLREIEYFHNTSPRGIWLNRSVDLSDFSGQTIKISFESWNDGLNRTHFWVDNVSFRTYP